MPVSLTETKDALVLRLKYHKTTLFVTCQPTTPLSWLKGDLLSAIRATNQPDLSTLPQYTQPDGKSYPDWSMMDAEQDIGLFVAGSTGDDVAEGMVIFMPLDQDTAQADATVRKAGLKDSDVVCVGFRARGASSISQPIVQFTDVEEEEDDAVDPDSLPPPLSD
ncbi:uncharacterized protein UTRI_05839 [Ustilago trichophora]|uniref:Uncharacterized protein n=1 Tax=Ustilago trichophora TaxID=86804 RepID=A0A5C3EIC9_9BASI|nr:uncharacterized protein UTRI_05839 [Ustilago trichophora]